MQTGKSNLIVILIFLLFGCNTDINSNNIENKVEVERRLPILGNYDIDFFEFEEKTYYDTIYHFIPDFIFTSHTGETITNENVRGKIYVADFFFTNCPSICPIMTQNLKDFHENTKDIEELMILSHTIDPQRDTLEQLNKYIADKKIDPRNNWLFLFASQEYTYEIGKHGYLINAEEDELADGGFLHSEHFVLIDREGRIRGMYEGTEPSKVKQLEEDIRFLLQTEYGAK